MRKKILLGAVIVVFVCVGIFSYYNKVSIAKEREDNFYKELDVFAEALAIIEKKYVESKPPHDLIYGALDGLLASLDSYSE
ncbi:MAG: peptidase S41, partial [Candidatus Omnitrophica bacterium]|nr:peptidase S41 [Candidatus Omnitrophota bacterium]